MVLYSSQCLCLLYSGLQAGCKMSVWRYDISMSIKIQDEDMSANVYRINMYPDKVTAFIFYQRDDFVKMTSSRPAKMQFLATLDGGRTLIWGRRYNFKVIKPLSGTELTRISEVEFDAKKTLFPQVCSAIAKSNISYLSGYLDALEVRGAFSESLTQKLSWTKKQPKPHKGTEWAHWCKKKWA